MAESILFVCLFVCLFVVVVLLPYSGKLTIYDPSTFDTMMREPLQCIEEKTIYKVKFKLISTLNEISTHFRDKLLSRAKLINNAPTHTDTGY
jgi:hypothetical protein